MKEKNITKKEFPVVLRFLIKLFQFMVYLIIQILFIPLAIIGFVDAFYRELIISKKLGVSSTAVKAIPLDYALFEVSGR